MGDDRLLERREGRRGILSQRNSRHHRAEIRRGDDCAHARALARGGGIDGADTPVRHRAAQDHRVQQVFAPEVVDELAASAQQPQILDALDRAADEDVCSALLIHALYCLSRGVGKIACPLIAAWARRTHDFAHANYRGRAFTHPTRAARVPTVHMTILACSLSSARATLSAASAEVFGLVRDGLPCSAMAKRPAAPSASILWMLPAAPGSATSSTCVASNPSPTSATAAATLAFCG